MNTNPEDEIARLRAENEALRVKLTKTEVLLGMPHERRLLMIAKENLAAAERAVEAARVAVREIEDVVAVRQGLNDERSAKEGWRARALAAEQALAAYQQPDPGPALRALEEAKGREER